MCASDERSPPDVIITVVEWPGASVTNAGVWKLGPSCAAALAIMVSLAGRGRADCRSQIISPIAKLAPATWAPNPNPTPDSSTPYASFKLLLPD